MKIRREKYDVVFNFHGNSTSYLFTIFSGSPEKIGLETHRFKKNYTHVIRPVKNIHSVLLQLSYLKYFNIDLSKEDISSDFFIPSEAESKVEKKLERMEVKNFILIHPNATLESKKWPEEKFAKLNDLLIENNFSPLFVVAPFELDVLEKIERNSKNGIKKIIADNIKELGAVIKKSEIFICCDSGPMHMGAALKKKILVIWGSSNYNVWHPWMTKFVVVKKDLDCMPCPGYKCSRYKYPRCIKDIDVEEVLRSFKELIEKN